MPFREVLAEAPRGNLFNSISGRRLSFATSYAPAEFQMSTSDPRNFRKTVPKRSVVVNGRNSSVSLEDEFWNEIVAIANARGMPVGKLIPEVDRQRQAANLSSAIRTFVLQQYYNC